LLDISIVSCYNFREVQTLFADSKNNLLCKEFGSIWLDNFTLRFSRSIVSSRSCESWR